MCILDRYSNNKIIISDYWFCISWLRHYATSQKVAGSIPDEVIEISIDLILPAALWLWGSNQPLTEMSIRNLPWGKGQLACQADKFTTICESIV
jgi:hypothetical protein